jgi:hypothetical protein
MKKEYDFSKMKELKNPYAPKKQAVGINFSPEDMDYFKGLADETGLPYQKLIDLYLVDCAKKRKKLRSGWRRPYSANRTLADSSLPLPGRLTISQVVAV